MLVKKSYNSIISNLVDSFGGLFRKLEEKERKRNGEDEGL